MNNLTLMRALAGLTAAAAVWAPAAFAIDGPGAATPTGAGAGGEPRETVCSDRRDDDGDGLTDCADHDCAGNVACNVGAGSENSDARCSDWFDNDGDGFIDCDDADCEGGAVTVCKGSWRGPLDGGAAAVGPPEDDMPELKEGMSVEDLLGKGADKDGERSDEVCSDGLDNDRDGRIDCADLGCRFDPDVNVCRSSPGMRFSISGAIEASHELVKSQSDVRFSRLQLRTFGQIPGVDSSFYYVGMRGERTPRVTFAMFQVPIGARGHFIGVNSGGGGLSMQPVLSSTKHMLIEPAYYVYSAFQPGNGAAVEASGPLAETLRLEYRTYVAGGSGRSTGSVGGTYFVNDARIFTWSTGVALRIHPFGYISRLESPFLYTPAATALSIDFGAKFDQRPQERFPAVHAGTFFRSGRFVALAEVYAKRNLDIDFDGIAYNVQAGFLAWPKRVLIAADFGEFLARGTMAGLKDKPDSEVKKQRDERQWRAAAHYFFYRSVGVLSAVYRDRTLAPAIGDSVPTREREASMIVQFHF